MKQKYNIGDVLIYKPLIVNKARLVGRLKKVYNNPMKVVGGRFDRKLGEPCYEMRLLREGEHLSISASAVDRGFRKFRRITFNFN